MQNNNLPSELNIYSENSFTKLFNDFFRIFIIYLKKRNANKNNYLNAENKHNWLLNDDKNNIK